MDNMTHAAPPPGRPAGLPILSPRPQHRFSCIGDVADYDSIKVRASVDWIDIGIQLDRSTNAKTVQKYVSQVTWAEPLNKGAGGAANAFALRVQAPPRFGSLESVVEEVKGRFPVSHDPWIHAIEVSMDVHVHNATPGQLSDVLTCMHRYAKVQHHQRIMVYRGKGEGKGRPKDSSQMAALLECGYKFGVGHRDISHRDSGDHYSRGYVKTTDDAGRVQLPSHQWSARYEHTFRAEGLSEFWRSSSFEDWRNCRFHNRNLCEMFTFRKLRDDLDPHQREILAKAMNVGAKGDYVGEKGKEPTLYRSVTQADTIMNKKVHEALRCLSDRWSRTLH